MVGDCFVAGNSPGKYANYHTAIEYLTMILVQRMASLFESELVSYDLRDDLFTYRTVSVLYASAKFVMRVPLVKPSEMDFKSGTENLDVERCVTSPIIFLFDWG